MDPYFVIAVYLFWFLPPLVIAWDAHRRGHRGIVWFLAGIAGPTLSLIGSLGTPSRDPVTWGAVNLLTNLLSYAMLVVLVSYLLSRPWRYPVVRKTRAA